MRTDSARIGREFEKAIQSMADRYCAQGLLRLRKVDPPMRIVGGRVIMLPNPHLDFVGAWTERGGRMLVVEAKVTREGRLPMNVKSGGLTERQLDALLDWRTSKALSFVLWLQLAPPRSCGLITVSALRDANKAIHLGECFDVPLTKQGWPDFLPVLRKIYP